ncbi:MAG: LysM peptidoglycan-binding domain-containing protein [Gammaproteobacteria bacterium]|nr:LysM peptidoglycan-binding domain-containing protein [Gammaproteobacteria bacterium]
MCYRIIKPQYKPYLYILPVLLWLNSCAEIRDCCSQWSPLDYTVQRGDTLYSIAWRYEMDYREIAQWNGISAPFAIYPGQRLRMAPDSMDGTIDSDDRESVILDKELAQQIEDDSSGFESKVPSAAENQVAEDLPVESSRPEKLTVQKGDTLYSLAREHQLTPQQLARWNGVRPPYEIYPGQEMRLSPSVHAYGTQKIVSIEKNEQNTQDTKSFTKETPLASHISQWYWPVKGKIIKSFNAKETSRKGIGIAGRRGQPVKAAAAGRVVYSGNGLISYGNLVIIKHTNAFLSAYAYNKKLLVKEGDSVQSGQVIAQMGNIEKGSPQLHFEIRKNGKPVDPLQYLPKI